MLPWRIFPNATKIVTHLRALRLPMVQTGSQTIAVGRCCALWTICELAFCFVFVFCKQLQLCRGVLCRTFVRILCCFLRVKMILCCGLIGNGCRWKQNHCPMIVDENYDYYRQCWQCLHQRREQKHLLDREIITIFSFSKPMGNSSGWKKFPGYSFVHNTIYVKTILWYYHRLYLRSQECCQWAMAPPHCLCRTIHCKNNMSIILLIILLIIIAIIIILYITISAVREGWP